MIRILFILFFVHCTAQENSRAKTLLDKVSNTHQQYTTMDIEFNYGLFNRSEGVEQRENGVLKVNENKFILEVMGIKQINDGNLLYTIIDENEEVTIQPIENADSMTIQPNDLFEFYKEGYTLNWDITQRLGNKTIQYIKLIPVDSESQTSHLLLGVDTSSYHIHKLIEVGKNKTETTITLKSFVPNATFGPYLFIFDEKKYSSYYIDRY